MDPNDWTLTGNDKTNPSNNFLGTTDDEPLVLKTNGREAMRIDPTGKIGIGTFHPEATLEMKGHPNQSVVLRLVGGDEHIPPHPPHPPEAVPGLQYDIKVFEDMRLSTPGVGDVITFTPEGNVGIGTSIPEATLHVSSAGGSEHPQVHITQTTPNESARLRFNNNGADPDSGELILGRPWDIAVDFSQMHFSTPNVGDVMTLRVDQPNNVGIATVDVLEITGGSDLAELFAVEETTAVEPGTLMVIDENHPGKLKISEFAYDRKVAGIVSGAGGINAGVMLQQNHLAAVDVLIALAGRVYCKAEAFSGPIEPGDFLTASSLPGHAMKASDMASSYGAIIGKAMTALSDGTGLVLVLVNLQ